MTSYKGGGALVVAMVALALSVTTCVMAKQFVVGDGVCSPATWGQDLTCDYNTWAKTNDYAVGDSLVFKFTAGQSNVAEVTKDDYDACPSGATPANPLYVYSKPPVIINLLKPGTFYFASTIGTFICIDQNLEIIVNGTASSSTPSGPATSSPTPADPTSSSTPADPTSSTTPAGSTSGSHSSIVGPVVGSIASVLVIAKIVVISYYLKKRRDRKQNILNGHVPPNHGPAPVYNFNVESSHDNVNFQGLDDHQASYGVPASNFNP